MQLCNIEQCYSSVFTVNCTECDMCSFLYFHLPHTTTETSEVFLSAMIIQVSTRWSDQVISCCTSQLTSTTSTHNVATVPDSTHNCRPETRPCVSTYGTQHETFDCMWLTASATGIKHWRFHYPCGPLMELYGIKWTSVSLCSPYFTFPRCVHSHTDFSSMAH